MAHLLISIFGFIALTASGQDAGSLKVKSNLYFHAADSLVRYILKKEKPSLIIFLADKSILKSIPQHMQGQEIIKINKWKKVKTQNAVLLNINSPGGTNTDDTRSVSIMILKYVDGERSSWEGYGGYNFTYIFNYSQKEYLLKSVSKSLMIR